MDFVSFLSMIIYEVLYTLYIIMMFKVQYLQRLVFRYKNINLLQEMSLL